MAVELPPGADIAAAIGAIDRADGEPALRAGLDRARTLIVAESRASTPAIGNAANWSAVLRHGVAAAVRLTTADRAMAWTWFVSGSAARGEAVPGSDVETLLALGDDVDADAKTAAQELAADVHGLLDRCDIGGDANGVLASRSRFCRRLGSWSESIVRWVDAPREDRGVVMTGIVADSGAVYSSMQISESALRTTSLAAVATTPGTLRWMLQDATAVRSTFPSRLRTFALGADTVDLKLAAIDPIVKTARWAALSAGSSALSTPGRLADAAERNILDPVDASTLDDCFQQLLRFRWQCRCAAWLSGQRPTDTVTLADLAPHQRAQLRSIAREVAGIRRKFSYLANTPGIQ
ncbi:putative nucleotidyltransferase substrate binding domain-containing protein [Mycolicibacterium sarraceniae]|uniref:Nucleotidyltransferase n=1 Tax=Mycolicibacterium sarraceniae TaxID=1534348 RepID=A0A7I7SRM1_9MYCO|nr:putative nucleotidyltransferase substrate binding domain-containing protein [Mycolicibacterium sarraceniae]BBY59644.1 hypothetical protein MSAR_27800 [Mycolicibacterium sarraceniae]